MPGKYTSQQTMEALELLAKKELLLNDIVMWLKAKGMWKQFQQESGWNIEETVVRAEDANAAQG